MCGCAGVRLLNTCSHRSQPPSRSVRHTLFRQRPYYVEYTRSHLNSEVKQRKARLVLGWGTAWELLWVLLAFYICAFCHPPGSMTLFRGCHRSRGMTDLVAGVSSIPGDDRPRTMRQGCHRSIYRPTDPGHAFARPGTFDSD